MLDKFWESLGEELAGEWLKHVFSPAFLFWVGGGAIYAFTHDPLALWQALSSLPAVAQAAALIGALIGLILSSLVMKKLSYSILTLLEGYWPAPLDRLADRRAKGYWRKSEKWDERRNALETLKRPRTRREEREKACLEQRLRYFPARPDEVQPTRVGNILRGAETAPKSKYGLDAVICWPHLWLLLPDEGRQALHAARQSLMNAVELWAWGLLFLVWTVVWPVALLIGLFWLWLAYEWLQQSAMAFNDLLVAAFDLYRFRLYTASGFPLPTESGETEIAAGKRLTEYLYRGTAEPPVSYQHEK